MVEKKKKIRGLFTIGVIQDLPSLVRAIEDIASRINNSEEIIESNIIDFIKENSSIKDIFTEEAMKEIEEIVGTDFEEFVKKTQNKIDSLQEKEKEKDGIIRNLKEEIKSLKANQLTKEQLSTIRNFFDF